MNQRIALIVAAALTAFMLVLVAGLATRLTHSADLASTQPTAESVTVAPATIVATLDPAIEALVREREAAYQAALTEANQRLAEANAQIAAANGMVAQAAADTPVQQQPAQEQAAVSAEQQVAPTYAFSADQAQAIALTAAPGVVLLKTPELVRYQGATAYEVSLDRGLVYVDAQSGAILNNGAVAGGPVTREQAIQAAQRYLGGGEVIKAELTEDRGITSYQVEFTDGSKVYVEASNGQVAYADIQGGQGEYEDGEHEEHGQDSEHEEHDQDGEHEDDD